MKLKFMFVNAVNLRREFEVMYPPLGLAYLASSIRTNFGSDSVEFKVIDHDIDEGIKAFKPDIVGITSTTQYYNRAISYAQTCKEYQLPVIIGGVHISALPSTLTKDMDVGVIGEGEETIIDLLYLFLKKGFFDKDQLHSVDGIVFKKDNELVITKRRKLIEPLDKIPMAARDIFGKCKASYILTSRGCPYRCAFCYPTVYWRGIRFFSPSYVVAEIKQLVEEHKVETISIYDSLFIADRQRLRQIVELLQEGNLLGKVSFPDCNARANLITDEVTQLLKRMNVTGISLGLESSSPRILEYLKGKGVTVEDNMNAVKTIRKYGIKASGTFIIGSPQETFADILQTLRFVKKAPLSSFAVHLLTPLPGTPVWEYAKQKGLVNDNMDWSRLDIDAMQNKSPIVLSEKLTKEELNHFLSVFRRINILTIMKRALRNPKGDFYNLLLALGRLLHGKPLVYW
ncbi:B12-binding domain-containing radical SAM protein [Patescibacteria group bacterium]|nr:B12-binding domain-containing radical SAM protein [Patescibacteria group bacterium]